MRLAIPDLVSNSYFPAIAAVELGLMKQEGVDIELELLFPVTEAARALRDGRISLLAGAAHAPLYAFPEWRDARLLTALSQNTYWFLVVRSDLPVEPGDVSSLRDIRIGAAPGPDLGLEQLLRSAGIEPAGSGITIAPIPGADGSSISFGVTAAEALADGRVDAFWANGMGAEVAVRKGVGRVIVDARRDGGEPATFTFPALMATTELIESDREAVSAAVRGIARAQTLLRESPDVATHIGERLFPAMESQLIAGLIAQDAPFYQPAISEAALHGLCAFARRAELLTGRPSYEQVVATGLSVVPGG